jgi:class 3 adenylate cyclase
MMHQLDGSYQQIKEYALNAAMAKRDEQKIRSIFQKYVPHDVIETYFKNPESMLVGDTRDVAILFSDIRSFTTISESSRPDELVTALNRYFSILVDLIMDNHGIVDKYIGDAVMAFFGAPVSHENDALDAVRSAASIAEALDRFNAEQEKTGGPIFQTGLGINYGEVTVGNIGSERKMDYTVIGDTVNLASRLEGLTKYYSQPLIISSTVQERVADTVPCRLIDTVVVKGKTVGERIYTARNTLSSAEEEAWSIHAQAMDLFYGREFRKAERLFRKVLKILPGDPAAEMFLQRAKELATAPPGEDWTGATIMSQK